MMKRLSICLLTLFMSFASSTAFSQFYDFDYGWNKKLPDEIPLHRLLYGGVAGEKGVISPVGEKLLFANGQQFFGWGVGIRITNKFPPIEKDKMKAVVDRIASFGFNHLRIYGFDNNNPGLFREWKKTGKLDSSTMNRVCSFINYAKTKGIYYTISPNHNALRFVKEDVVGKARHREMKRYKVKQLFDKELIKVSQKWVEDLFQYSGGECLTGFGRDPANIFVDTVNEASIFEAYDEDFKFLSQSDKDYLTNLAKDFSRKKGFDNVQKGQFLWGWNKVRKSSRKVKEQVAEFLTDIESGYYKSISDALRRSGYRGLINGTNHWYGEGGVWASSFGDAVEMHAYFDRPRSQNGASWLLDWSYLENFDTEPVGRWNYTRSPLHLLFESSLKDKPMIVSEWNHGSWSKYSYEGPVLISVFSALQDFAILDIHTYQESTSTYTKALNRSGFSFSGNPVLMALQPSLALAFIKDYIPKFGNQYVEPEYSDTSNLMAALAESGVRFSKKEKTQASPNGFFRKYRRNLLENKEEVKSIKQTELPGTLQIGEDRLLVDFKKFKAAVGSLKNNIHWRGFADISVEGEGAITAVPLDDLDITSSGEILLTTVADYTRKDRKQDFKHSIFRKGHLEVQDPGHGTPMLRSQAVTLVLKERGGILPKLLALFENGEKVIKPLKEKVVAGTREYTYQIRTSTPWYKVVYKES